MLKRIMTLTLFASVTALSAQAKEITLFSPVLNQFHNVRDLALSADASEAYFTVQSPSGSISQVAFMTKRKGRWSEPQLLQFCDQYSYLEPFLSHDGNRLYFASDRPLNLADGKKKDFDIWFVERKGKNKPWSEPQNLGSPVNSPLDEFYPSLSANGNIYFTVDSPKGLGKDDIYYCQWQGANYTEPILLSGHVNSSGYEFNAFITKDEQFLLYTKYNEADGQGSGDLYLSRKDKNGEWQKAENVGTPINTKFMEYCPFYHEKNEMLYFTSKRQEIEPGNFKNMSELQHYLTQTANGLSKIYKVPLKLSK